jgi:hypothetical protein
MKSVLAFFLVLCGVAQAADKYSDDMYRRALENRSTAPMFVLITLHNPQTGTDRAVCIQAPFLLGAIHRERHIEYDEKGSNEALRVALMQPGRRFTLTNAEARRNVQPVYTPEILGEVRSLIGSTPDAMLVAQLRDQSSALHQIYGSAHRAQMSAYGNAIAHVLLERGILVGVADIAYRLYAPP